MIEAQKTPLQQQIAQAQAEITAWKQTRDQARTQLHRWQGRLAVYEEQARGLEPVRRDPPDAP